MYSEPEPELGLEPRPPVSCWALHPPPPTVLALVAEGWSQHSALSRQTVRQGTSL